LRQRRDRDLAGLDLLQPSTAGATAAIRSSADATTDAIHRSAAGWSTWSAACASTRRGAGKGVTVMGREQLDETPLFVAATRPALIWGLPLGLWVLFIMVLALIMIIAQNPLYEIGMIPVWFVIRLLVRYDYNAVRIGSLWLQTKARSFDAHHWGGASPTPFPIRPPKYSRGIA
jgi:type IV secretion system protein VirB3